MRRGEVHAELIGKPRYELGRFWVRFDTGQALTREGELNLSDKELKLMELFVSHENKPLSRTDILEEVWGMGAFPTDRTVDNFVMRLRKLFEEEPDAPVHWVTLRGRGYLFRREGLVTVSDAMEAVLMVNVGSPDAPTTAGGAGGTCASSCQTPASSTCRRFSAGFW